MCQRAPPCASDVLYLDTHARVQRELETQLRKKKSKQCYAVQNAIATANANGVAWSSIQAPPELKASPWFPVLSAQQQKNAAYSLMTDSGKALFRDVQTGMARVRVSSVSVTGKHLSMTILPKQAVLVFRSSSLPRLLLVDEAMILHGFPVAAVSDLVEGTANHVLADLAGNMASPPVILALTMAAVASVEWHNDGGEQEKMQEEEASEVGAAMFAFSLLVKPGERVPSEVNASCSKKIKF